MDRYGHLMKETTREEEEEQQRTLRGELLQAITSMRKQCEELVGAVKKQNTELSVEQFRAKRIA